MTYYSREGRGGFFPVPGQPVGPPSMARQPFGFQRPNAFPQVRDSFYPYNPQNRFSRGRGPQPPQPFNPYQQMPNQGGGFPNNLNTIMGHVGTITNGINMMRQVGSILSLFRI